MLSIARYDRFEARLGTLSAIGDVTHTEELCGEDTLDFVSLTTPDKGDRLVWADPRGNWHEHLVVRTVDRIDGMCEVHCEASQCELLLDFIEDEQCNSCAASAALARALSNSRFVVDLCDDLGTATARLYHTNVLASLRTIEAKWGGELEFGVTPGDGGLVRWLRLRSRIGSWRGARFSYGHDLANCTRTVLADDVYTALYGYGAGIPAEDDDGRWTGGYRRKITFGEVNGGLDYVADEDARLLWGRWNADHTAKVHSFGSVTFSDCDDPERLLALTQAALEEQLSPKVSYEADVALIDEGDGLAIGDEVAVVDASRDPAWHLRLRVSKLVHEYGDAERVTATLGATERLAYMEVSDLSDAAKQSADAVGQLQDVMQKVTVEVFPDEPEPEPSELKARALLLDDGTLEMTYMATADSPSGGTVSASYDLAEEYAELSAVPWHDAMKSITSLLIDESFAESGITSMAYWLYTATNLASASGMENVAGLTSLRYAFTSCAVLAALDLRGVTLGASLDLYCAFSGCEALATITVDADWALPTLSDSYATFNGCYALVGGNGTTYSISRIAGKYMVVDTDDSPGYLTAG